MKAYMHGECVIKMVMVLPSGAKKVKPIGKRWIIAESEQSGNHHIVEECDGLEMYDFNGTLYLKNDVEANVSCVLKERHDTEVIPSGIWKIERANEYDFLKDETRKVAD